MGMAAYMAVALLVLSLVADVECSGAGRSSAHTEPMRRRGNLSQRGRRKNIWSYNPGHRSLAFLVAGEVEMVSPPPGESVTGAEYRCLGCCGVKTPSGRTTPRPDPSNRLARLVLPPVGLAVIGTEPNSVNDRCLGCCEDPATPITGVTTGTTSVVTPRAGRVMKGAITSRQRAWQAQRGSPYQRPHRRHDSSSSSEEVPPPRSRMQPIRSRMDTRCRHLGCRSPLGSVVEDSSSSEED